MPSRSSGPRALLRRAVIAVIAAVTLCVAAPAGALAADYVAMGDSYASGTGTKSYYEGCERSVYAYPYLLQGTLGSSFKFIACGGAKTADVLNNQVSSLSTATKYVTISIGGNDAGFSDVVTTCAEPEIPFTNPCQDAINKAQTFINNTLPGRLNNVYSEIEERAPNAVVAIVGYPRLFNGEDCNAATFFSSSDLSNLNATADILANVTRTRARAYGFTFVDSRAAFKGHAVCDDVEWLNGLSNPVGESFHPNRTGHGTGFLGLVRAAALAAPSPNAPAGGVGRLAFASIRSGNSDVWVVNADGQFPENLTQNPAADVDPVWSPDGTKVAFASDRDGDNEIYVANGDGTSVTKLDEQHLRRPRARLVAQRRVPRVPQRPDRQQRGLPHDRHRRVADEPHEQLRVGLRARLVARRRRDRVPAVHDGRRPARATRSSRRTPTARARRTYEHRLVDQRRRARRGRRTARPSRSTRNRTGGQFDIYTMPSDRRNGDRAGDRTPPATPTRPTRRTARRSRSPPRRSGNDDVFTMTSTGGSQTNRTSSPGSDTAPAGRPTAPPRPPRSRRPSAPIKNGTATFTFSSIGEGLDAAVPHRQRGVQHVHVALHRSARSAMASTRSACGRSTPRATPTAPRP